MKKNKPLTLDMTKNKYTGRHRLGLNSIFVHNCSPFQDKQVSINSNATEQNMIISPKLAEQQKNQRNLQIKNRISKQTQDTKGSRKFITYN